MSMINSIRCAGASVPAQSRRPAFRPARPPASAATTADVRINLSQAARSARTAGASDRDSAGGNRSGINPALDAYIVANVVAIDSPAQQASLQIRNMFRDNWGQDVDPDHTFLTTLKYIDHGTNGVKPAEIVRSISLTRAMLSNAQESASGEGSWQAFDRHGGPRFALVPELPTVGDAINRMPALLAPVLRLAQAANPMMQLQPGVHTYEAIYRVGATPRYDHTTQLDVAPQALRAAIWNMDPGKTHAHYLDQFWRTHEAAYPLLAKLAYVQAYQLQFQEGTLSATGRALAARLAGLEADLQWRDLTLDELRMPYHADSGLDAGLLDIHGYQATDILYATDKKHHTTLLYLPGNSSPLHEFESPAAMKSWIASQARDDSKRAALLSHFKLADRPDGYSWAGVDEALQGLAAWPAVRHASGGLLSFNRATFSGYWNPQRYINQEAGRGGDPFTALARQQKIRSYADAALLVRSDRDVGKANASRYLEAAAMVLAPLALLVPGAGLAVDAALLSIGVAEIGIGADDVAHGKLASGQGRIAFGLLNALPVAATVTARSALQAGTDISNDIVSSIGEAPVDMPLDVAVDAPATTVIDTRLLPYVSSRQRAGLQMDAQGMYWIAQRPYAAIGEHLFQIQRQGPGYRVLAEGDMVAGFNAPLLRRRADGIWQLAPTAGLRGGGDVDDVSSFSTSSSVDNAPPISRAPLAQAQSNSNSFSSSSSELAGISDAGMDARAAESASGTPPEATVAVAGSSGKRRFSYTRLAPPVRTDVPPEVMQSEAQAIYDEVRKLYKKGAKSSNKLHLNATGDVIAADRARQQEAGIMLKKFVRHPNRSSDVAAAERLRIGNCYEMARSVIWRAQQQGLPVRLGYIAEGGDHFFAVVGDQLPGRVRHIGELQKAWVADPWSGIFAPAAEYEDRFVAKMNKWTQNNKVVCFHGNWMHANDPRWLDSVIGKFKTIEPISYTPVNTKAGSQVASRLARCCGKPFC